MEDEIIQEIIGLSTSYNNSEISSITGLHKDKIKKILLGFGIINDNASSTHRSKVIFKNRW